MESHLLQMRGLKLLLNRVICPSYGRIFYRCVDWNKIYLIRITVLIVASFTDAWIETIRIKPEFGLRFVASFTDAWIETLPSSSTGVEDVSHLLQMRGLKLNILIPRTLITVASFTDAWIETYQHQRAIQGGLVASFTDAWIETRLSVREINLSIRSHLLQMRGLKLLCRLIPRVSLCRIFYRCVDWNWTEEILPWGK